MAIYLYDYQTKTHTACYEGCVLGDRERNYYDDSDFYAVVWDEAEQRIKEVEYATTRFPTDHNYVKVDATAEVKEKAASYIEQWLFDQLCLQDGYNSKRPEIGKLVRVVSGRKVPVGTEGIIFWMGEVNYGRSKWSAQMKYGISPSGEKNGRTYTDAVWTYGGNIEVVDPDSYLTDKETLRQIAKRYRNDYTIMSRQASSLAGMIAC